MLFKITVHADPHLGKGVTRSSGGGYRVRVGTRTVLTNSRSQARSMGAQNRATRAGTASSGGRTSRGRLVEAATTFNRGNLT